MGIWITGDTHTPHDIAKLSSRKFPEGKQLTRDDFLIVAGDFGGVWHGTSADDYYLDWFEDKPWTTLFVDGNHENFPSLNRYPVETQYGGRTHQIRDHVHHLMRGEVFFLGDKTIFAMGGAASHDKECRIPGLSWWPEELPSHEEYLHAENNLLSCDYEVDLIVTHCAPTRIMRSLNAWYEADPLTNWFDHLMEKANYKHWYFGHYHIDQDLDSLHTCLYQKVQQIG